MEFWLIINWVTNWCMFPSLKAAIICLIANCSILDFHSLVIHWWRKDSSFPVFLQSQQSMKINGLSYDMNQSASGRETILLQLALYHQERWKPPAGDSFYVMMGVRSNLAWTSVTILLQLALFHHEMWQPQLDILSTLWWGKEELVRTSKTILLQLALYHQEMWQPQLELLSM